MHPVHEQVLAFIDNPASGTFEQLALAVFAHQFACCAPYQRYCLGRESSPDSVNHWRDIPAVPVEAFKHVDLGCAPPERTFLSTGTTAGRAQRSRHLLPDVRLYQRSALASMRVFLFPDAERLRLVSLVPSADMQPDSSLSQMVTWALQAFGDDGSTYVVGRSGIDFDRLVDLLRAVERCGQPACLLTTTGALIQVIDRLQARRFTFRLPHGSRLMDTGGEKGAPRHLSRNGILRACWNTFAIPGYFCVNEYGMAELSSQFYDSVITDRVHGRHRRRRKLGPHWVRTVVLDPGSLAPAAPGSEGLLCHFDLANAGTAMAVLTEDVGCCTGDGFHLVGRAAGAEARGCSLSAAEWAAA